MWVREEEHPSLPQGGTKALWSGQESPATRRGSRGQCSGQSVQCPRRELERTGSVCSGRQDQSSKMKGTTVESVWDHLKYSEAHGCKV